jgi:adenylate kinase family enzyme
MDLSREPMVFILRGPAGAGKSTVSASLVSAIRSTGRLCAHLEQDYFRMAIAGGAGASREYVARLLLESVRVSLDCGYDVVMEGILNIIHFKEPLFDKLLSDFGQKRVKFYYFDVPFEETVARHLGRSKAQDFGVDELAKWFSSASRTGYDGEVILNEIQSSADAVEMIFQSYFN